MEPIPLYQYFKAMLDDIGDVDWEKIAGGHQALAMIAMELVGWELRSPNRHWDCFHIKLKAGPCFPFKLSLLAAALLDDILPF